MRPNSEPKSSAVQAVEALMLHKFRTEPFHNLHLLFDLPLGPHASGGTCSDKTLSFYDALCDLGVAARLHTAFIRGQEIHRLVKLEIEGQAYFADVGNGWPSLELYPLDRPVSYRSFGIRFRTAIEGQRVDVYSQRNDVERHQMEIRFDCKPQAEILADIKARFDSGITYPFSGRLRFSQVVGDAFLFLRDDRLEIYRERQPTKVISGLEPDRLPQVLMRHFGFDLGKLTAQGGTR
jgi:arylamine N-acetyltransferase